ncbi:MAG: HAMP domain-containing sensor histidine kinase [Ilumatobacteraceae bacterium]
MNDQDFSLSRGQRVAVGILCLAVVALVFVLLFELRYEGRDVALLGTLGVIFLANNYLRYTRIQDFRRVRARLELEHKRLAEANIALTQIDDDLQFRLDEERKELRDRLWFDSAVRSISVQLKSTLASDKITEFLAQGLGRELKVDSVVCYSFDELLWSGFVKQWHRQPDELFDESALSKYEEELLDMVHDLWNTNRVLTVNDSHLFDPSKRAIPELAAMQKEIARSWVLAPVADGSSVIGFVAVMMKDEIRVWEPIEISLIRQMASETASVCVHARMFNQSLQIAANDSEVERLVELGKLKNSFIENMNHELRTPLTSIIGYLEVIMDDVNADTEPELASSLVAVQRNALRLQILIENMMQISKTDFEHAPLVISTVDVGHLLNDAINSLKLGAEDGGVEMTLRMDSPASDLIIDGDVNQLEQVFVNLLSNAIKFTPRDGSVTLVARRFHAEGDFVEVKVIDTGIGIPTKEFPNVFQRFFRASTATSASIPGFGIGLSLVQSIVREHNGTVTFDSIVGKGTTFTVKLPARHQLSRQAKVAT